MAIEDLREKATQLVSYGKYPALVTRVSIPNVNLLSKKGSILYGTGNPAKSDASIDGTTYQYAEVEALSGVDDVNGKSVLFNDGDGNLSWTNVVDNLTTNDGNKVLSAQVGYDIDSKIHISEAKATPGITMGAKASTKYNSSIAIGSNAIEGNNTGFSTILGNSASIDGATDCIAIGNGARISQTGTRRYSSIQLGNGTNTTPYSFQVWNTPMLIDGKIPLSTLSPTITVNEQTGLVLSNGQTDYTMSYDGTVVLGPQAVGTNANAIAIGAYARAGENAVMIGGADLEASVAENNSVSIGCGTAAGAGGIAIGFATQAKQHGIAIGDQTSANEGVVQLGNSDAEMSLQIGKYPLMNKNGYIIANRITPYYRHCIGLKANVPGAGSTIQSFFIYFEIINKDGRKYTKLTEIANITMRGLCNGVGGAGSHALRLIDIIGSDDARQARLQLSTLSSTARSIVINEAFQNITNVEFTDTVTTIE